jgi:hypothetical protein
MSDPRVKALIRQGIGRMGSVMTPGWQKMLDGMPYLSHPGFGGARAFARCRKQGAIARAGRGGGKSTSMLGRFHSVSAAHPNQASVFVTISAERSRDILGPAVWKFNEMYGCGIEERRGDGWFLWPNGYRLLYRGCKDVNECNKRRGTPWVAAGWDECASINQTLLAYDIHECVEPRLVDFNGLWFAGGTPGALPRGYWHDLSSGQGNVYPVFSWDARHNPHMPNVLKYFSDTLQRMQGVPAREKWPDGYTSILDLINDPACWKLLPATFVREYLGQWVLDLKAIIYKLTPKNSFTEFPVRPDYWTIGLDLGAHSEETPDLDHAAVSVCASSTALPYVWVREARKLSDVTVESLAEECRRLIVKYPQASVHIDGTSAGKLIERSLQRMGIPVQCADKARKLRRIQLVQSAIRGGTLQMHLIDCMDARNDATNLLWTDERNDHSPKCDDDTWDAILYGATPHMSEYRPPAKGPEVGSEEWQKAQELAEYEAALQAEIDKASDPWGKREPLIWMPEQDYRIAA